MDFGFLCNISAMAAASDFKIGMQQGFAETHNKISPRKESGRGPGLWKLPYIWGFSLIFLQSYLACSWGLLRPITKSDPTERMAWPKARKAPKHLGFSFNISALAKSSDFEFGMQP